MPKYSGARWDPGSCPQGSFSNYQHGSTPSPFGVVLHRTYGAFQGDYSVGKGSRPPTGFHFLIAKSSSNGTYQFYDTNTRTAHAGENRYGNDIYLGIEFEGVNEDALTSYQVDVGGDLIAWICSTHDINKKYSGPTGSDLYDYHGFLPHARVPDQTHSDWISDSDWAKMTGGSSGGGGDSGGGSDGEAWETMRNLYKTSPIMTGKDVTALQKNLKGWGYSPGAIDGQFGSNTDAAVKNFQKANGLTADGNVGPATRNKINGAT